MSLVKRCFGAILLTLTLSATTDKAQAAAAARADVNTYSAALAVTHNHDDYIALHANRTNQTCLSTTAHFLAFAPREIIKNSSPKAEAAPEFSDHTMVFKADLAYFAKIILLLIIAVLGVVTFVKFRANKADMDE